jgi:hypothetical protein
MLTLPHASYCPVPSYICKPFLHYHFFTYLENQLFLLVVQKPIHSCPWFDINCSPLAASPTPKHPTDHVTISTLVTSATDCITRGIDCIIRDFNCIIKVADNITGFDYFSQVLHH